jgi:hypothetical protein
MCKPAKALKLFRLETEVEVSVSDCGIQVQTVRADFIPINDREQLRSYFRTVGLSATQIEYALRKLDEMKVHDGFLIPIDQQQT